MDFKDAIRESRQAMLREQARMKAAILAATKGQPEAAITRALREAYPFGERKYHPFKMWRAEVRYQRKLVRTDKAPMELFAGETE